MSRIVSDNFSLTVLSTKIFGKKEMISQSLPNSVVQRSPKKESNSLKKAKTKLLQQFLFIRGNNYKQLLKASDKKWLTQKVTFLTASHCLWSQQLKEDLEAFQNQLNGKNRKEFPKIKETIIT